MHISPSQYTQTIESMCFLVGDTTYQFTCLPFGIVSAPWVFTKTQRPVSALRQELGMWVIVYMYIDDILLIAESKEEWQDHASGLILIMPVGRDKVACHKK